MKIVNKNLSLSMLQTLDEACYHAIDDQETQAQSHKGEGMTPTSHDLKVATRCEKNVKRFRAMRKKLAKWMKEVG